MHVGIGLPNPIPGTRGKILVEWARRAEERGFSSLATIGRVAYPNYESLVSLAAAAAVTERIGLLTNILLGPTRDPVLLAKQAASVDQISDGRLTLGVGVGGREDDFEVVGKEFSNRGERWDETLELLQQAWQGEPVAGSPKPVTPPPVRESRVPLLIGGTSDATLERVVRWGIGWTAGGMAPEEAGVFAERVRQAWQAAGREGEPRLVALNYFALGENARERGAVYIRDYYGFLGDYVDQMVQAIVHTPEALQERVQAYQEAGFDELIFDPTIAELDQVDLLAEVVL
ncbi:MAG: TIGR03619 family F420-dependent LLM class oxidoreductase [Chloroflexota bacterium]|nr:TIGR03619 family F420-dependent LLM class oxidoreductase [Chloroflexota bacterium]